MCYMIITAAGLIWFITTLIAAMLTSYAIVTPKWLVGPERYASTPSPSTSNVTTYRYPSVGIYSRCIIMDKHHHYHCGAFDLDGFATDNTIYPPEWKAAMFFATFGFVLLAATVFLTIITCCRQSFCGKSVHNITGAAQAVAGISILIGLFLHPLGWGAARVIKLCGSDAEAFYPAECHIGLAAYSAAGAVLLAFLSAAISMIAESSNMRSRIKRRIESGERLVCVP